VWKDHTAWCRRNYKRTKVSGEWQTISPVVGRMARPTGRGRASIRVARREKLYRRETARTEAVGLQPKRSVTPAFVNNLLVPGLPPSEKALTTTPTRIMLLQPLILGLGTIATAILNSKRQFLLPALSIAVYDLGLIGGLLFSLARPGVGIYGPTFGLLASALCLVGVQIPGLLKQGVQYTFIWNLKHRC
jgi:hypothetical protein